MNDPTQNPNPQDRLREALKRVQDPEMGVNIVDLGLIYEINLQPDRVNILMTLTSPACPMGAQMKHEVESIANALFPEATEIRVEVTHDPPWSPDKMSPEAKEGMYGRFAPTSQPASPEASALFTAAGPVSPYRPFLLFLGAVGLMTGLWTGLTRLGFNWPLPRVDWMLLHGPLMIGGFLGTVIGLERAVALGRRWAYLAPILTGLGVPVLLAGGPGALFIAAGSLMLTAVFVRLLSVQRELSLGVMGLGALVWALSNIAWLAGLPLFKVSHGWAAFLILTIAGERLELSRFLNPPAWTRRLFLPILLAWPIALLWLWLGPYGSPPYRFLGAVWMATALWLLFFDAAKALVRRDGLQRYIGVSLFFGFIWLGVGGALSAIYGAQPAGLIYDAVLHAAFLGFAFTMIFAHAPVILPAVLGLAVSFSKLFYVHLILLQISLAGRIGGDLAGSVAGRQHSSLLNAIAILLFIANMALAVGRAKREARA